MTMEEVRRIFLVIRVSEWEKDFHWSKLSLMVEIICGRSHIFKELKPREDHLVHCPTLIVSTTPWFDTFLGVILELHKTRLEDLLLAVMDKFYKLVQFISCSNFNAAMLLGATYGRKPKFWLMCASSMCTRNVLWYPVLKLPTTENEIIIHLSSPLGLTSMPQTEKGDLKETSKAEITKELLEKIWGNRGEKLGQVERQSNQKKRRAISHLGDWVWMPKTSEYWYKKRHKLRPRKSEFKRIEKFHYRANPLKLRGKYNSFPAFLVTDIAPCGVGNVPVLRSKPLEGGGNDVIINPHHFIAVDPKEPGHEADLTERMLRRMEGDLEEQFHTSKSSPKSRLHRETTFRPGSGQVKRSETKVSHKGSQTCSLRSKALHVFTNH